MYIYKTVCRFESVLKVGEFKFGWKNLWTGEEVSFSQNFHQINLKKISNSKVKSTLVLKCSFGML